MGRQAGKQAGRQASRKVGTGQGPGETLARYCTGFHQFNVPRNNTKVMN